MRRVRAGSSATRPSPGSCPSGRAAHWSVGSPWSGLGRLPQGAAVLASGPRAASGGLRHRFQLRRGLRGDRCSGVPSDPTDHSGGGLVRARGASAPSSARTGEHRGVRRPRPRTRDRRRPGGDRRRCPERPRSLDQDGELKGRAGERWVLTPTRGALPDRLRLDLEDAGAIERGRAPPRAKGCVLVLKGAPTSSVIRPAPSSWLATPDLAGRRLGRRPHGHDRRPLAQGLDPLDAALAAGTGLGAARALEASGAAQPAGR